MKPTLADICDAQERILLGVDEPADRITILRGKDSIVGMIAFVVFFALLFFV